MASAVASMQHVFPRLAGVMLSAGLLLPVAYLIPRIDLTGPLADAAYWTSASGGTLGTTFISIGMAALLIGRSGITWKQRGAELLVIVLTLAVLFGGAAYLNEFVVKPQFAAPRPNILELASPTPEASVLKMSSEEFYAIPNKPLRSDYLRKVLTPAVNPPMSELVRGHWIHETGYSFPSGHSFSAMLVCTVFLALGMTYFSGPKLWLFCGLVPWAVAVCVSRPVLQVHSATDVCVGGIEGIVVGMLAFLLVRWSLDRFGLANNR